MRYLLIACFCLFAQPSKAIEISMYEQLPSDDKTVYIGGVAAGMSAIHFISQNKGYRQLFCLPDGTRLGGDLARVALMTFKDRYSSDGAIDVSVAVLLGLQIMFPCR